MDRGAWQATVYGIAESRTQVREQTSNTLEQNTSLPIS